MKTICVSGGFDIIHNGHIRLIRDAAKYGNVIVILNSDDWLKRKKGYSALSWNERAEILHAIRHIVDVVGVNDKDGTVCEALARIKPNYFANGGDRTQENTPELMMCRKLKIKPLFGVGGGKVSASSAIARKVSKCLAS